MTKLTTEKEFIDAGVSPPCSLEAGLADLNIGQRIAGTSPGAVYYLIAKTDGLAVAMRWKGAQLSVRVSGSKLSEYVARLTATGLFANHDNYFSAHMGQQGLVEGLAGSVSAQMLYASVLAAITGEIAEWAERAPYEWRNWLVPLTAN